MNAVGYYWRVDDLPIEIASWVEKEVLRAITYYWTVDPPSIVLDDAGWLKNSQITVRCSHQDWPNGDGQTQHLEVELDLVEELKGFANPYADLVAGGHILSDEQAEDVKARAVKLRWLAEKLTHFADEAERVIKTA